ncbi:UPF0481 protein [Acorus calamus]|uniref:UPF0481 protein n=1 Tax=Acorus calamus TaxID=4465 RepID=A0AAV9CTC7_ACOCL|nr:UPF0481 protein [Acorus calamus]
MEGQNGTTDAGAGPSAPPMVPKKEWVDLLRNRLGDAFEKRWREEECSIFMVPGNLRALDPDAYEPGVVSIGPYHRGKERLRAMEEHKWRMARRLFDKHPEDKLEECLQKMMALEGRARSCYSERVDMGSREFAEMMLLDGCFILGILLREKKEAMNLKGENTDDGSDQEIEVDELFRSLENNSPTRTGLLKLQSFMKRLEDNGEKSTEEDDELKKMLMALTNVDPLFGKLDKLMKLAKEAKNDNWVWSEQGDEEPAKGDIHNLLYSLELVDHDLLKMENQIPFFIVEALFDLLLPPGDRGNVPLVDLATHLLNKMDQSEYYVRIGNPKVHHLLHLFHVMLVPDPRAVKPSTPPDDEHAERLPWPSGTGWMLSATEQRAAGIVFKQKRKCSFLDVTFNNGVMEIPVLCIYEHTIPILRNLIAFEQCYPHTMDHITYYAVFMERMIKTPSDVRVLQGEGILRIGKSNEEEMARLFGELCTQVFVNNGRSYLNELFYAVNKHCGSKWNKWRAVLARDYFKNPWAIISLAAAIFLIILTLVQTYTSVYSYVNP